MELYLGEKKYDATHRALIMGILNRTRDSFYDGGKFWKLNDFLAHAEKLVADGADVLDVGGVRAGPDEEISAAEELDRVGSAVELLHERFDIPLSVDTWRAEVAKEAFKKGAVLGNDISGFADLEYLKTVKSAGASVIACHMRLAPRYADPNPVYGDIFKEVKDFLAERTLWAKEAGISAERIFIDVGLDFGKTYEMSSRLFSGMDYFQNLGHTMVLAASNKEFLGYMSGAPLQERNEVSLAACALGIKKGCRLIRVHNVKDSVALADRLAGHFAAKQQREEG